MAQENIKPTIITSQPTTPFNLLKMIEKLNKSSIDMTSQHMNNNDGNKYDHVTRTRIMIAVYLAIFAALFALFLLVSLCCWFSKFKSSLSYYSELNEGNYEKSLMDSCCPCFDFHRLRMLFKKRFGYLSSDFNSESENFPILNNKANNAFTQDVDSCEQEKEKDRNKVSNKDETRFASSSPSNFRSYSFSGKRSERRVSPPVLKQKSLQLQSKTDLEFKKMIGENLSDASNTGEGDFGSEEESLRGEKMGETERKAILHEKRRRMISAGDSVDDPPHLGTLLFKLEYDFENFALNVTIHRASDLPIIDQQTGSCNPYIKITLLPEKKQKARTRMLQNTRNAAYEETFTFNNIPYMHLRNLSLHFLILSFDKFSRDDVIGEVELPLNSIDLSSHPVVFCKDVEPTFKQKGHGLGEVLVSLCYQPSSARLTVVVMKARHLPKMDVTGSADPYVKLTLLQNDGKSVKKKTHIKKRTLHPTFNESFLFDISSEEMTSSKLQFDVIDYDIGKQDDYIGQVVIGPDAPDRSGCLHWKKMLANPRKQISDWHQIMNPSDLSKISKVPEN